MNRTNLQTRAVFPGLLLLTFLASSASRTPAQQASPSPRVLGTVQAIHGKSLTVLSDSGAASAVSIEEGTKLLQIEPGKTDLKEAKPLLLSDLEPGDRVLVRGVMAEDGKTLRAASLIAMKKAAISEKQSKERSEWQRGVGGLVKAIDAAGQTVVLATNGFSANREITLHLAKDTMLRRYASDSTRFDAAKPSITDPSYVSTHAGAGPRRIQMSPNGKFLYVDHETDSEVGVYAIDGGKLTEIQVVSTLPADFKDRNTTAEIVISADGRHLYVGNRGHDSVAIFTIDPKTGKLSNLENVPSGGKTPRNLRFDPTGNWFFAANENGGNITEFKVDKKTGRLTPTGVTGEINTPGGMYFFKVR